ERRKPPRPKAREAQRNESKENSGNRENNDQQVRVVGGRIHIKASVRCFFHKLRYRLKTEASRNGAELRGLINIFEKQRTQAKSSKLQAPKKHQAPSSKTGLHTVCPASVFWGVGV